MRKWIRRHRENLTVWGLGLAVFTALNVLMLQTNFTRWTSHKIGAWSAFHNGFDFSGFDQHAYIIISKWRPLYTHLRHPLLSTYEWPLAELNGWMKDTWKMNCAIFIVAVLWTLFSTVSWVMLYKLLRRIVGVGMKASLLLCFFYFSLAYVMLATFVPDHMILSMTLVTTALYLAAKARKQCRRMKMWQALALFFVATGVTTTNAVKVWMIEVTATISAMRKKGKAWWAVLHTVAGRSLLYLIPLALLVGMYMYEEDNSFAAERAAVEKQTEQQMKSDSTFRAKMLAKMEMHKRVTSNQIAEGELFKYTNNSIDRWRTLKDNIFGEGMQLHEDYLLQDANLERRPVFVSYRHWWNDAVEALIVLLFVAGLWCGRRHWLMWMAFTSFAFDMLLHVGLSFALFDVYIMTAHWAVIIPISLAFLIKESGKKRWQCRTLLAVVLLLTIWLWWHNAHLIAGHILK